MVACTKPQQRKREESERLRGERDQIKFIHPGFERWQVVRLRSDDTGLMMRQAQLIFLLFIHIFREYPLIIIIIIKTISIQANLFSKMNLLLSTKGLLFSSSYSI